jgi:tetratricopeptide (TPR) repeat protein
VDGAYQVAISELSDLARKYPNRSDLLSSYGSFFQAIGRYDLAFTISDRCVELDPLSSGVHFGRGVINLNAGRLEEARQSLTKMELLGMNEPALFAGLAFEEGDALAIQKELDRGRSNWGNLSYLYPFYEAAIPYLKGEHAKARDIVALLKQKKGTINPAAEWMFICLEGDLDLALDSFARNMGLGYSALRTIQAPAYLSRVFPEYRSHPKYQKMLRDVGLDRESIAKLRIPPLPF